MGFERSQVTSRISSTRGRLARLRKRRWKRRRKKKQRKTAHENKENRKKNENDFDINSAIMRKNSDNNYLQ